jgi:hypothetical protein
MGYEKAEWGQFWKCVTPALAGVGLLGMARISESTKSAMNNVTWPSKCNSHDADDHSTHIIRQVGPSSDQVSQVGVIRHV